MTDHNPFMSDAVSSALRAWAPLIAQGYQVPGASQSMIIAASLLEGSTDMLKAPKTRPILAWCDHEADPYIFDEAKGSLTLYAAHAEGMSHAPTGFHVLEWGGAFDDSHWEDFHQASSLPDWWFVQHSEFEVAANPVRWWELPTV